MPDDLTTQYELGDSAPPAAESPPAEPTPAESRTYQHSAFLTNMALELGFSDNEIAQTAPHVLEPWVMRQYRQAKAESASAQAARAREAAVSPAPAPPPPPAEEEPDFGDISEFDDRIQNALKTAAKYADNKHRDRIKKLEEQLESLLRNEQVRSAESLNDQVDRAFAKHEAILGKGGRQELDQTSREFHRRMAVLAVVDRDTAKDSLAKKIDRAVDVLYGQQAPPAPAKTPPPESPELAKRRQDWLNGGVARPTPRAAPEVTKGRAKAEQSVKEMLDQAHQDGTGTTTLEDFPE